MRKGAYPATSDAVKKSTPQYQGTDNAWGEQEQSYEYIVIITISVKSSHRV